MRKESVDIMWAIYIYNKFGYPKGKSIKGLVKSLKEDKRKLYSQFNKKAKVEINRQAIREFIRIKKDRRRGVK